MPTLRLLQLSVELRRIVVGLKSTAVAIPAVTLRTLGSASLCLGSRTMKAEPKSAKASERKMRSAAALETPLRKASKKSRPQRESAVCFRIGWVLRTNCLPGGAWATRCSPAVHPHPIARS